jgi:hypothetical protein
MMNKWELIRSQSSDFRVSHKAKPKRSSPEAIQNDQEEKADVEMSEDKDNIIGENIRRGLRKNKVQNQATLPSIKLEEFESFRDGVVIRPSTDIYDEKFEQITSINEVTSFKAFLED